MEWLTAVVGLFGLIEKAAPVVEKILAGLGAYLGTWFSDVFGAQAADAAQIAIKYADDAVVTMDRYVVEAETWLRNAAPTVDHLLAMFPGIDKELLARKMTMDHLAMAASAAKGRNVTFQEMHGPAAKLVHSAHSNARATVPTVVPTPVTTKKGASRA